MESPPSRVSNTPRILQVQKNENCMLNALSIYRHYLDTYQNTQYVKLNNIMTQLLLSESERKLQMLEIYTCAYIKEIKPNTSFKLIPNRLRETTPNVKTTSSLLAQPYKGRLRVFCADPIYPKAKIICTTIYVILSANGPTVLISTRKQDF